MLNAEQFALLFKHFLKLWPTVSSNDAGLAITRNYFIIQPIAYSLRRSILNRLYFDILAKDIYSNDTMDLIIRPRG